MDIRNSLESLRSILGPSSTTTPAAGPRGNAAQGTSARGADQATLSSAGSEVSQTANADGVRMEKVASIQAALAAGTYNVPTEAVASKMVDAMLGGGN
jgi:negative regulator of flagellin synthesis FlgM